MTIETSRPLKDIIYDLERVRFDLGWSAEKGEPPTKSEMWRLSRYINQLIEIDREMKA